MCSRIEEKLSGRTLIFSMDRYYRPFDHKDDFERQQINFDKPETLDWELIKQHLVKLRQEENIKMPKYSFEKNTRVGHAEKEPHDIVLIEGIHAFHDEELNQMMDLKVFLDPDPDIRAVRRMKRDVVERGRNAEFAARQYLEKTRNAHHEHVEPTRQHADLVLDHDEADQFIEAVTEIFRQDKALDTKKLRKFLNKQKT